MGDKHRPFAALTIKELHMLEDIQYLLDEAYDHYFENSDGHCKMDEGYIELRYPSYFDRQKGGELRVKIGVYSYVLGPSRMHWFDTIPEALDAVKDWHAAEMEQTYSWAGA